ncbi:MAG: hypothetical protein J6K48_13655 [Lachnospiraceae bacterium]|nr:hypothetical protein [Lachnospiraceae bacterium]
MERKNIFDILNEKGDINYQIRKIEELLSETSIDGCTPEEIVDTHCMCDWKARGRYTSCAEIRERLQISKIYIINRLSDKQILLYLEYVINIVWLCREKYLGDSEDFDDEYLYLQQNTIGLINDLGYEARVFEDEEKVILVEKDAAMTSVAEIVEPELANEIIEYNHHLLKGDIAGKRKILKTLADKFEPMRGELKRINKYLESNTGYLLNKMNIRHNNIDGSNAIEYVKNLSDEELEEWYDETYQMLLLCILEYDNIERSKRVDELKRNIEQK